LRTANGSTTTIFEGDSENGNTILFDADAAHAHGPSPMEAVLMALCACTSVDVVSILKKKRQPLTGCAFPRWQSRRNAAARIHEDQADLCREREAEPQGGRGRGVAVEEHLLLGVEDAGEIGAIDYEIVFVDGEPEP
jgi:putative redox protein